MIDIVLTLVFSIVMLLFMLYPSMIITKKLALHLNIADKYKNIITIVITVILSLFIGVFLKF